MWGGNGQATSMGSIMIMRAALGHGVELEDVEDDEDIDHVVTSSRRGARISGQSTPIYLEGRRVHSPRKLVRSRHRVLRSRRVHREPI